MTVQELVDELRKGVPNPDTTKVVVRFEGEEECDALTGIRLHPGIRVLELLTRLGP